MIPRSVPLRPVPDVDLPADFIARGNDELDFSRLDPGPPRSAVTRYVHSRLAHIREQSEAGVTGWFAVISRSMENRKAPLKPLRDGLRKSHPGPTWKFRVLTEYDAEHNKWSTLWAHYEGARVVAAPVDASPARSVPVPPHSQALRGAGDAVGKQQPAPLAPGALPGMDWASEAPPPDAGQARPIVEPGKQQQTGGAKWH